VTAYDKNKKEIALGSGFYFLEEDLLVTNYHVISDASYILFKKANPDEDDEESYDSVRDVVAVDRDIDLVVFRTKRKNNSFLSYGKSTELKIGEKVYVAGNPRGFEGTFSDGLLSNRFKSDGIANLQITAPISSGSSGGPLLNANGDVVGVVTASIKKGQNMNLAIPSYYIVKIIEDALDDSESAKDKKLTFDVLEKGRGKKAVAGDTVTVHYVGMLPNKKVFDSSTKRGEPFTFKLGAGQVIKGWDQGIKGMRIGEIRTLSIPADLAYGPRGVGDVIPPNSPLIFNIRLLEINSSNDKVGH
jgi:S1-C subfamily serine protease